MAKNTQSEPRLPKNRKDHPVTMGVFEEHRQEMKAFENRFIEHRLQMKAFENRVDARFDELAAIMRSGIAEMRQIHHQSAMRFEQQQHENDLMMEHLNGLFARQKRVEERVDGFDATLKTLRSPRRPKSQ